MKVIPRLSDDEYLRVRYSVDQWKPAVQHRKLQMVKTGTWLFGLLNTYQLVYTDWTEQ
jgi:hypothetical protein